MTLLKSFSAELIIAILWYEKVVIFHKIVHFRATGQSYCQMAVRFIHILKSVRIVVQRYLYKASYLIKLGSLESPFLKRHLLYSEPERRCKSEIVM